MQSFGLVACGDIAEDDPTLLLRLWSRHHDLGFNLRHPDIPLKSLQMQFSPLLPFPEESTHEEKIGILVRSRHIIAKSTPSDVISGPRQQPMSEAIGFANGPLRIDGQTAHRHGIIELRIAIPFDLGCPVGTLQFFVL